MKNVILVLLFVSVIFAIEGSWEQLDKGLYYGRFKLPPQADHPTAYVDIIKINPGKYDFELLLATEYDHNSRSMYNWAKEYDQLGTINAGMYQADNLSSTGYLVDRGHINNNRRNSGYKMYFVCNPRGNNLPEAQLIDTQQYNAKKLIKKYHTVLQCIRMVASGGKNVWYQKDKDTWSEAALAEDTNGNILFIYCEEAYQMHELVDMLLQLPLKIDKMMHLEGGYQASMYFKNSRKKISKCGKYDNPMLDTARKAAFWYMPPIPNAIGFRKK